jgi:hypothetical protein
MHIRILFLVFIQFAFYLAGCAQNYDEFTGPYKSWADVKKRFGAIGDGKHDDTKALQTALDSLTVQPNNYNTGKNAYTTIYLPAGTYNISATLQLKGKIGINIIGEDPAKTIVKWTGAAADTVLWANGSAYFKISRITWDANNMANMEGIGIYWKDRWNKTGSQCFASLNIEISDCEFRGKFFRAISGGTYNDSGTGMNDSEVAILRCSFYQCTNAGITIKGFNALDYWIWDCRFIECWTGVVVSSGNYHIYRSYFERSKQLDILNVDGYYTSVRGCYSTQSRGFSFDTGGSCNPFKRIFQSNTVSATSYINIHYYHLGKVTLFDNVIEKSLNKEDTSTLTYQSWCPGIYEVLSVNNRYEVSAPYKVAMPKKEIFSINDKRLDRKVIISSAAFLASQQTRPVKANRTVFEVPVNAGSKVIQSIIDQAAALQGKRPVVHFPYGSYDLSQTLEIPANSDMQITGDGNIYASVLTKGPGFPAGKPLVHVAGPTYITMRDIQIGSNSLKSESDAIVFSNIDEPAARIFIDQLYASSDNAVHLDGMDYLYVQKDNSFFSYGNRVIGGKLMQQGKGTAGLYCFGGQYAKLSVQNNGRFVAKDCWWEGADRIPLNLEGSGKITIDGFMLAPQNVDSGVSVAIGSFKGQISLLNAYLQGSVSVAPNNPDLNMLLWNIHSYHKMDPLQFTKQKVTYKGAFAGLSSQCFTGKPECQNIYSIEDKFLNISNRNQFISDMVAQDREAMPQKYTRMAGKASNVFMTRVTIGQCNTGIRFIK